MTAPPRAGEPSATKPGSQDRLGADSEEVSTYDAYEVFQQLFPAMHRDPTGSSTLRDLQKQTGYFEQSARFEFRIKSPSRGDIIINLNPDMAGLVAELLNHTAEQPLPKTRSGRGFNARMKKKTPTENLFGRSLGEGH